MCGRLKNIIKKYAYFTEKNNWRPGRRYLKLNLIHSKKYLGGIFHGFATARFMFKNTIYKFPHQGKIR